MLNKAATTTGDVVLQPGQFRYVLADAKWMTSGDGNHGQDFAYLLRQKLETWIPADRRGEWLHRRAAVGAKEWLAGSPADEPVGIPAQVLGEWRSKGGPHLGKDDPANFANPTPAYLAKLPRDPNAVHLNGRKGSALGLTANGQTSQIVIDAERGDYLGSRTVLAADWLGVKAGTETGNSSVTSKVVGALGAQG
ncbi:hypothetical protein [Crossiella sp. NPDC003009]